MNLTDNRKTSYVSFSGGMNITTPIYEVLDGEFVYTYNMESNKNKGLTSAAGYERIDGNNVIPSKTTLHIYTYTSLTGAIPVQGDIVNSLGTDFTVCGINELTSTIYLYTVGSAATVPAPFTTTDGDFTVDSYRYVQRIEGSAYNPSILTQEERPFYDYCIEQQRLQIQPVPGEGPVKGVAQDPNSGNLLAIRFNGTNDVLYEAIVTVGWTEVTGTSFTNANYYRFAEITQATTARRLYIANGIDNLHYFDSNAVTPVGTVVTQNIKPEFISYHDDRVVVATDNKVYLSSRETPNFALNFFGLETNYIITGLSKLVNDGLLVTTEKSKYIQQGSPDPASGAFGTFKEVSTYTGAIKNTVDSSDYPYYINEYGVSYLTDTDRAGQYQSSPLSDKVLPIVSNRYDRFGLPISYVGASIDRHGGKYRAYSSDGTSIVMLNTQSLRNVAKVNLRKPIRDFPITFNDYSVGLQCIGYYRTPDAESIIAGSGYDTNFPNNYSGYVYKMESGYSLDGIAIQHSFKTSYIHAGSPTVRKRFFKFTANVSASEGVSLAYKADFDAGNTRYSKQLDLFSISGLSRFNQSVFNSTATWTNVLIDEVGGYINGSGINMSLNFNSSTLNTEPFVIQGITYHYATRQTKR